MREKFPLIEIMQFFYSGELLPSNTHGLSNLASHFCEMEKAAVILNSRKKINQDIPWQLGCYMAHGTTTNMKQKL